MRLIATVARKTVNKRSMRQHPIETKNHKTISAPLHPANVQKWLTSALRLNEIHWQMIYVQLNAVIYQALSFTHSGRFSYWLQYINHLSFVYFFLSICVRQISNICMCLLQAIGESIWNNIQAFLLLSFAAFIFNAFFSHSAQCTF